MSASSNWTAGDHVQLRVKDLTDADIRTVAFRCSNAGRNAQFQVYDVLRPAYVAVASIGVAAVSPGDHKGDDSPPHKVERL